MHKALIVFVAAAVLSSPPLAAKPKAIGPVCNAKIPVSQGSFYGVRADQYTAKPQPNLSVKGAYRSPLGMVTLTKAAPGGIVGSTLLLKLAVGKQHVINPCQPFSGSFEAKTAQFNKVQIDGPNGNITVPVHVWR